jgi:hypothetical protein
MEVSKTSYFLVLEARCGEYDSRVALVSFTRAYLVDCKDAGGLLLRSIPEPDALWNIYSRLAAMSGGQNHQKPFPSSCTTTYQRENTDLLAEEQVEMSLNSDKRAKGDIQELHNIELSHQWDPNLPQEKLDEIYEAVKTGDHEKAAELDKAFVQDSQYEEVRAAVRNTDGGEPANTVRAWVLGMLFTTVGSGLNMFLSMR